MMKKIEQNTKYDNSFDIFNLKYLNKRIYYEIIDRIKNLILRIFLFFVLYLISLK